MRAREKVLLVSDQARNLGPIEACLSPLGYELLKASDFDSATLSYHRAEPDLVILDLDVPDADGAAFVGRVRAHSSEVPIIMLTDYSEADLRQCGWQIQADEFLEKPVDATLLSTCVQRLVPGTAPLEASTKLQDSEDAPVSRPDLLESAASDLKQPLAAIHENIKWTCARLGNDQAPLREALEAALENSERASSILEELRSLAAFERRMLTTSRRSAVSLSKLLTTTIAHYQGSFNMRGILLETELESHLVVQADPKLLQTVLERLFDDVIRTSPRATRLFIKAQAAEVVELTMITGVEQERGVRNKMLPSVVRAPRGRSPQLGRHFCERAVASLDGEMLVQESSSGTQVRIRLPRHISRSGALLTAMFPALKAR